MLKKLLEMISIITLLEADSFNLPKPPQEDSSRIIITPTSPRTPRFSLDDSQETSTPETPPQQITPAQCIQELQKLRASLGR